MKLGELLIRESLITQARLDEALNAQLVYGGSLGTCLVELGHIDERALGRMLSKLFGIEYAPPEAFHDVPRFAIDAVPAKVAEKHLAVPLALEQRTLAVAMADPTNLAAVDALGFASGYSVTTLVSAEVRIYQALERYYHIPRRLRYVRLCAQLEETVLTPGVESCKPGVAAGQKGPTAATASVLAEPATATATATLERPASVPVTPRKNEDPLSGLIELMCRVKDEAMLGQVFLDHLASSLGRTILFQVRGGTARVWDTRGIDDGPAAEVADLSITSEPVFRLLAGQTQYTGPVPGGPSHVGFFEKLNFRPPQEMVLAPAYLNDRLVGLLYGDNGVNAGLPPNPAPYRRMMDKLALALGLVDLKRRLRET